MEINEKKIRIKGVLNSSQPLEIDKSYDLAITSADCTGSKDVSNNDGTFNRVFDLTLSELSNVSVISGKEIIHTEKKGSMSKVLHRYITIDLYDQVNPEMDREDFYKAKMLEIIEQVKKELE